MDIPLMPDKDYLCTFADGTGAELLAYICQRMANLLQPKQEIRRVSQRELLVFYWLISLYQDIAMGWGDCGEYLRLVFTACPEVKGMVDIHEAA